MHVTRLFAAFLLIASSAHALPPPGTNLSSPEHAWWECHHQPEADGKICCNVADGHVLKDNDWKIGADRHYKVRVDKRWFDVPPDRVIQPNTQCGPEPNEENRPMAKVWYAPTLDGESNNVTSIEVYCFMSGQLY